MEDNRKSLVGGIPTPLKNDGVKVSWDHYSIPNFLWKVIQNSMVPVTTNQNPILDSESMSHFKIFSNWELYPDFLPSDVLRSAVSVPATRCLVEATEANTRDATRDMGVVS